MVFGFCLLYGFTLLPFPLDLSLYLVLLVLTLACFLSTILEFPVTLLHLNLMLVSEQYVTKTLIITDPAAWVFVSPLLLPSRN